jgi:hypothetical protein
MCSIALLRSRKSQSALLGSYHRCCMNNERSHNARGVFEINYQEESDDNVSCVSVLSNNVEDMIEDFKDITRPLFVAVQNDSNEGDTSEDSSSEIIDEQQSHMDAENSIEQKKQEVLPTSAKEDSKIKKKKNP